MEVGLNGAGDRRSRGTGDQSDESPSYVRRRLFNRLPVPVFLRSENVEQGSNEVFCSIDDFKGEWRRQPIDSQNVGEPKNDLQCSTISIAREYLSCPICNDPCIESTSINCGHKFCKECIEEWRRQKPICPICSTLITSLHRLYSDDLLLESQLENVPVEVRQRFKNAQKKRLEKLMKENKSSNMMKRVRQKLDNSITFLRCKNVASLESASQNIQNKVLMWTSQWNVGLILGVILVAFLILLLSNIGRICDFLQYLWLAARKYDGTIPQKWLKEPAIKAGVRNVVTSVQEQASAFETFVFLIHNRTIGLF